ncbi:DUF6233 domain-containing protein [Streptomyces sp. 351MFTsu5.1]|uniref:DUF6233 domain-containing protein n=1 Tax=Streptomyces sp. 351MFTsu5.1 TaxID=1172180 RepID=UPI000372C206|nr:DUF6233 domain-containing protein [Streptomyces sp. 351MFTsu5.1]
MPDLPPDLPRLRTLETWLAMQLAQVRDAIAAAETREKEQQRGIDKRPAPPDWLLDHGLNRDGPPACVHAGGCHMAGKRSRGIDRAAALRALADGTPACSHCRPDSELGYLDG